MDSNQLNSLWFQTKQVRLHFNKITGTIKEFGLTMEMREMEILAWAKKSEGDILIQWDKISAQKCLGCWGEKTTVVQSKTKKGLSVAKSPTV